MDEIVRELLFKYSDQYFITMQVPYESKRKLRFGIVIDSDGNIKRTSGSFEYLQNGQLHQTIIPLKVEGAVLITYTPKQLRNTDYTVSAQ